MALIAVPGATAVSESFSRVNGFIQGCGEAGVLIMSHLIKGTPVSPGQLTSLIQQSVNSGHSVSQGGATTLPQLQWLAQAQGIPTAQLDWQTALRTYTGRLPIEIGVSNASALGGNNVGVSGHYIDVLGFDTSSGNYLVADPNQAAAKSGQLVEYSPQQIANAAPFGAIVPQISGIQGVLQALAAQTQTTHATQSTALLTNFGGGGANPIGGNIGASLSGAVAAVAPGPATQTVTSITPIFGPISTPVSQTAQEVSPALTVGFSGIGQAIQTALGAAQGAAIRGGLIALGVLVLLVVVVALLWSPLTTTATTTASVARKVA